MTVTLTRLNTAVLFLEGKRVSVQFLALLGGRKEADITEVKRLLC